MVATESVLRSDSYKTAVAVGTVVLFGTLSLILYPVLYKLGLLELDLAAFAIYVGATVHEVAQVVAIGNLVGVDVTDKAIVVKLTRVFLLVPTLLVLAWLLRSRTAGAGRQSLHIPWFAVGFVAVVGFHSLHLLPPHGVALIVQLDTFLLTVAMCALGLETTWAKVKAAGLGPFYLGWSCFSGLRREVISSPGSLSL